MGIRELRGVGVFNAPKSLRDTWLARPILAQFNEEFALDKLLSNAFTNGYFKGGAHQIIPYGLRGYLSVGPVQGGINQARGHRDAPPNGGGGIPPWTDRQRPVTCFSHSP